MLRLYIYVLVKVLIKPDIVIYIVHADVILYVVVIEIQEVAVVILYALVIVVHVMEIVLAMVVIVHVKLRHLPVVTVITAAVIEIVRVMVETVHVRLKLRPVAIVIAIVHVMVIVHVMEVTVVVKLTPRLVLVMYNVLANLVTVRVKLIVLVVFVIGTVVRMKHIQQLHVLQIVEHIQQVHYKKIKLVMKILMMPNEKTLAIIGEQPVFANKDYRFMKYCLVRDFNEGKIIYNSLTSSMVMLEHDEINEIGNINKYAFLYKNYFLVPEDFDEMEVTNNIINHLRRPIDDLYLNNPTSFTILTTMKCNARCFYCYELHKKNKKHMTDETAEKIADYIHTYAPMNQQISLSFFGGEPLFNQKPIDIIVNKLIDYNRPFVTNFTTNGYLFNKELVIKAKNIWNTSYVQITLDGTEEVYNKAKNYIYKDGESPYKRVLNNIAILMNYGIRVIIRFNIDLYNSKDLRELVISLYNRFGNHPNLSMYAWPIFEDEEHPRTPEEHAKVFEELKKLEETKWKCGYIFGYVPPREPRVYQCMADDGASVLIDPSGNIGTCEHFVDSHFWGHIDDPLKKNFDELNIWREYMPVLDICKDCPLYPICNRPAYCEEMSKCDKYYQEWRIRRHLNGLDKTYLDNKGLNNYMPYKLSENVN